MDLVKIIETFPTQEACIAYLERLRWQGSPERPQCESTHVRQRNEHAIGRIGRYNCHECKSTFKATHGTLFQGTKIPLQKWFLAISLMANGKKSLSSCSSSAIRSVEASDCLRLDSKRVAAFLRSWRFHCESCSSVMLCRHQSSASELSPLRASITTSALNWG